jgi:hypothetical protein
LQRILLNHLSNTVSAFQASSRELLREEEVQPLIIDRMELTAKRILSGDENRVRRDEALTLLPEPYRQALLFRHRYTLSFAELGWTYALSESEARELWARAVRGLSWNQTPSWFTFAMTPRPPLMFADPFVRTRIPSWAGVWMASRSDTFQQSITVLSPDFSVP